MNGAGDRLFVVSGCSGSGKSALIAALEERGEIVALEPGRRIVKEQLISPPWEDLFGQDAERRHTFGEAVAEYEVLVPTYRRHGYEIVFIPQASVPERVSFVLSMASPGQSPTTARGGHMHGGG